MLFRSAEFLAIAAMVRMVQRLADREAPVPAQPLAAVAEFHDVGRRQALHVAADRPLELERMPGMQQSRLVASFRLGLGRYAPSGSVGSIEGAAVLYNITV